MCFEHAPRYPSCFIVVREVSGRATGRVGDTWTTGGLGKGEREAGPGLVVIAAAVAD